MLTFFDPQPDRHELPDRFPDPFAEAPPHPLARRAAEALRRRIEAGELGDLRDLRVPGRGKMFGVLVVATADERIGYLCGFSGMLDGRWEQEGFVPPLFDLRQREAQWPALEAEFDAAEDRLRTLAGDPAHRTMAELLEALDRRHAAERAALRDRHAHHRQQRHERRRALEQASEPSSPDAAARKAVLAELAWKSRLDEEESRALRRTQLREREALLEKQKTLNAERIEIEEARADRSRQLWREIGDRYLIRNARGEVRSVGSLYAPAEVPGGAGDCAGPKLLGWAYAHGHRPIALAEFWWGAPPLTGDRTEGAYYPACQRRCSVVLPFMLQGLDAS